MRKTLSSGFIRDLEDELDQFTEKLKAGQLIRVSPIELNNETGRYSVTIEYDEDKEIREVKGNTLELEYSSIGLPMFRSWKFPRKLLIPPNNISSILILGVLQPRYGCAMVVFKYSNGGLIRGSRIEDIDTFIKLFGSCEV